MPYAVTHVLIPIILLSLFRDYILNVKARRRFPLHYILIGGVAGLLPDIDIIVYYILGFFGYGLEEIHRVFTHNIFVVLLFIILGLIVYMTGLRYKELGKHHLRLDYIFYVIAFGVFMHLVLDVIVLGNIMPFYPFSNLEMGLNIVEYLPIHFRENISASIDAVLLVLWLVYMDSKSRFNICYTNIYYYPKGKTN